ncbi:phBC6A51 family helix-turn-helix protein [Desulforamulus aeronauticus]|uniref:CENP-B N-terminal DNA-binding domain-containing protein n=1 Tax=Desulforamulus aeronauticus DSM 10349 TaxID=1121421 RepID=A0A1M6SBG2_9FIRM|nr:phBC6A51 family helix-turn-helix protein [Desulforamulus aeronauticus]SHK42061.1 CENP-B N-terminal DNA-binding domain-containing protein [Desulforamulus aeronauticus DSM 10349]
MLDDKKVRCIEMLVQGELTKTEIAKRLQIDRTTIYNWLDNKEFMAELDKRLQEIKTLGEKEFNAKLLKAIDEYWYLIQTTKDSRTKEKALSYWIDRSLGKTVSQFNINATAKQENADIKPEDLEKEFEEWEDEIEE